MVYNLFYLLTFLFIWTCKTDFPLKLKKHNKKVSVILMSFVRVVFYYYLIFIKDEFSMKLMINKYVLENNEDNHYRIDKIIPVQIEINKIINKQI